MADDKEKSNKSGSSFEPDKSSGTSARGNRIDVTKPRANAFRERRQEIVDEVPEPTEKDREREALERLKNKASGGRSQESPVSAGGKAKAKPQRLKGEFSKNMKVIIAIILVIIIIIIMAVFVIFIGRNTSTVMELYDIRISMKIENKSTLSMITETGEVVLRKLNPGDTLPLRSYACNAESYRGDALSSGTPTPPQVYVRYKIILILDYKERTDVVAPIFAEDWKDLWYRYNAEDEKEMAGGGTPYDDGYYYYRQTLPFNGRIQLFNEIQLVGKNLTVDDGGKYGQIQVIVEAIEVRADGELGRERWPSAPRHWVVEMTK